MTRRGKIWARIIFFLALSVVILADVISSHYKTWLALPVTVFWGVLWLWSFLSFRKRGGVSGKVFLSFWLIASLTILLASCFIGPRNAVIKRGPHRQFVSSIHWFVPFWDKVSYVKDTTLRETVSAPLSWGQPMAWDATLRVNVGQDTGRLSQAAQLGSTGWKNQLDASFANILQERVWRILRKDLNQKYPTCPVWVSFCLTDKEKEQFERLGYEPEKRVLLGIRVK